MCGIVGAVAERDVVYICEQAPATFTGNILFDEEMVRTYKL